MKIDTIVLVIKELIGETTPFGCPTIDKERLENLKKMCEVIEILKEEVYDIYLNYGEHDEEIIKEMRQFSKDYLFR